MYLYYPIMVIENEGVKELTILTVPNKVKIHVTPELRLSNILKKDTYTKPNLYNFEYASGTSLEEKKNIVWDYYSNYNLSERADKFTFDYLNNKYQVELNDAGFQITWLNKLS